MGSGAFVLRTFDDGREYLLTLIMEKPKISVEYERPEHYTASEMRMR